MEKHKSSVNTWIVVIVLIALFAFVGQCSYSSYKEKETNAWNAQFEKDPSTWTNEEESRYDDYMEWLDKN